MSDGKRIVRNIETGSLSTMLSQAYAATGNRNIKRASELWANPDRYMDTKVNYDGVMRKGISEAKRYYSNIGKIV